MHRSFGIVAYKNTPKRETEFLLVKNKSGDHWGFPKGTPDEGEAPEMTARREFEEETGIKSPKDLLDLSFTEEYTFRGYDGKMIDKINTYFVGQIKKEEKIGKQFDDIEESRWLSFDEALKVLTYQRSREILTEVRKAIS
ncbi:MAG TPA: NUDIX domain-containing protein [Candidatus Paceibacterota bacterium]|nr:NUDIX domain-containing protein [Candidatus Paceibacterota bacterium]